MMTRVVKMLFFLGVALLAATLVAPSFIDWNKHKAEVIAQIQPYFQRKVTVTGNVSFKILPQPEIMLQSVSIANAEGSKAPALLTLKSIEARVKLEPLLEGRIEVDDIKLIEPVLNLELAADGKTNLSGVLAPSSDPGALASAVRLNGVTIENGTIHYSNPSTGVGKTFGNLSLFVRANTLLGPYKINGTLLYQKTKVSIAVDTGIFDKGMSASTNMVFLLPEAENVPHMKLNGVMNLQAGLELDGELSISQGRLGSMIDIAPLNPLDFMNDNVDMTGTLQFKDDQLTLSDLTAKFEKSGALKGKIVVHLPGKGKTVVQAYMEGNGLSVTTKPSDVYINVPTEFQGSLRFKGKNIIWDGRRLNTADISTTFKDKEWTVKSALVALPGNTQIKFAGTVSPDTNSAAYTSLQITTDDLGKMVDAFSPGEESIFSTLGGQAASFKKLQLTSGLEISPGKISFYNMDATIDDGKKLSGVLNVERVTTRQNVTAKVHLSGWDSTAFSNAFLQAVMKSDADLELTADNFTRGALKITDFAFKGKTDAQGLAIQSLHGHLSGTDTFSMAGRVATLAPTISGLDVSYTLKSPKVEDVARNLGFNMPSLTGSNLDIKGTVKGDAGKYTVTAQGSSADLSWAGLSVARSSFNAEIAPATVKISDLTGTVWDGNLKGNLLFNQAATSWSSAFQGNLKQVDLQKLQETLGLQGFKVGRGDIEFDLSSADSTPGNATGSVKLRTDSITVDKFNTGKLADTLRQLKTMPDNLRQLVDDILHKNGSTVFKDVQGAFKVEQGKAIIETLELSNISETLSLSGSADIGAGSYAIAGELKLAKPDKFPSLKVTRKSEDEDYKVDSKPLESYVKKNLPPPPVAQTEVTEVPTPAKATKPTTTAPQKEQPITDILERLEQDKNSAPSPTEPAPPPQSKPVEQAPAAQKGDFNKIIQEMQMQDLMKQDDAMPVPLTPSAP